MDNFNLKLNGLKINIINMIKGSEIPIGAIYYMLKDLLSNVEDIYKQSIEIEKQTQLLSSQQEEKIDDNGHQE